MSDATSPRSSIPQRPVRAAEQEPHPASKRPRSWPPPRARGCTHISRCAWHRHPHRRGPGTALGACRLRRSGRQAARAGKRGSVALRAVPRGHQDREIAQDAGPSPDGGGRAPSPQGAASKGTARRGRRNGAIMIWSSPPGRAVPWTRLTSGGNSRLPAGRRGSESTGHRGNCATPSCP